MDQQSEHDVVDMWDLLLDPKSMLKLAATRTSRASTAAYGDSIPAIHAEQVTTLLKVGDELKHRYQYSQNRVGRLKEELAHLREQSAADLAGAHQRAAVELDATQQAAQAQLAAAQQAAAAQVAAVQQAAAEQLAAAQQQHKALLSKLDSDRAAERQRFEDRLAAFHAELERLNQGVQGQAAALDTQLGETRTLRSELGAARDAQAKAESDAQETARKLHKANSDGAALSEELQQLRHRLAAAEQRASELSRQLHEAEDRATHAEVKVQELKNTLVGTKSRSAELSQVESLYQAARDEIGRLDKENRELKDMISDGRGAGALPRSRILEALSPGRGAQYKSIPLHLTPEAQGKRRAAVHRRHREQSPSRAMGTIHVARDVLFDFDERGAVVSSPPRTRPTSAGTTVTAKATLQANALPTLSWLGPPTSTYPADPDQYEYLRVAGGYAPKWLGTKDVPKASGWVPRDVVRIVQAFKHAYGISSPDWRFWEPLLLLIDEVYAGQTSAAVSKVRAASAGRVRVARREAQAAADYPGTVQAGRIAYLKKQLHSLRQGMAELERRDDGMLRRMAEKEYHMIQQLDEVTNTNATLRGSLRDLDELYHT